MCNQKRTGLRCNLCSEPSPKKPNDDGRGVSLPGSELLRATVSVEHSAHSHTAALAGPCGAQPCAGGTHTYTEARGAYRRLGAMGRLHLQLLPSQLQRGPPLQRLFDRTGAVQGGKAVRLQPADACLSLVAVGEHDLQQIRCHPSHAVWHHDWTIV